MVTRVFRCAPRIEQLEDRRVPAGGLLHSLFATALTQATPPGPVQTAITSISTVTTDAAASIVADSSLAYSSLSTVVDSQLVSVVGDVVKPVATDIEVTTSDLVVPVVAPVVNDAVAPIVAPVVNDTVVPIVTPLINNVVAPVVDHVVAPLVTNIVTPVVDQVVAPVVTDVIAPVANTLVPPVLGLPTTVGELVGTTIPPVANTIVSTVVAPLGFVSQPVSKSTGMPLPANPGATGNDSATPSAPTVQLPTTTDGNGSTGPITFQAGTQPVPVESAVMEHSIPIVATNNIATMAPSSHLEISTTDTNANANTNGSGLAPATPPTLRSEAIDHDSIIDQTAADAASLDTIGTATVDAVFTSFSYGASRDGGPSQRVDSGADGDLPEQRAASPVSPPTFNLPVSEVEDPDLVPGFEYEQADLNPPSPQADSAVLTATIQQFLHNLEGKVDVVVREVQRSPLTPWLLTLLAVGLAAELVRRRACGQASSSEKPFSSAFPNLPSSATI